MTGSRVTLECFDSDRAGAHAPLSDDYKKGHADGVAQAENALAARRHSALADISGTLGDMAFGYAEARDVLLDQLRPVLAQIAEAVLPEIARETFAAHLIETLYQTFEHATEDAVEIAVSPEMVGVLSLENPAFSIVPDGSLSVGQARLSNVDRHIMIDLPNLVEALRTALAGLEATQRTHAHG